MTAIRDEWTSDDGQHRLILGDCLDVLKELDTSDVALLLTDPQYGISQAGIAHKRKPGKGTRLFDFFDNDVPYEANRLALTARKLAIPKMKPTASAYWWLGHYTFGPMIDAYHNDGWKTRFLVWSKACPAPPPPGSGWPSGAELCVYAFRPGRTWTHNGTNTPRSNVIVCDSYRHGGIPGKVGHPTQKPFGVIIPLIKASSHAGDLILDPFAGSFTVAVACARTGRRSISIEIEPRYFQIGIDRMKREAARHPLLEPQLLTQGSLL